MPRKKAEPEVLQEETVQPEIVQVEETVTAEQPVLEPQVEEPAITEPVQPYGEDDVPAAAGVEHDLCLLPQPKRHARHDHRRRSPFHDRPQRADRTGRDQADVLCGHCAVPRPHSDPRNGNVGRK